MSERRIIMYRDPEPKMSGGAQVAITSIILFVLIMLTVLGMWGCPKWNVYRKTLSGEAQLKEAEWSRQIAIKEAMAKHEAAEYEMKAEILRAKGAAEAMAIIDSSLTPEYIKYLWVNGLHDGSSEIIYVPTEANLPILEATRKK
jgi:hypothetical protein